MGESRSGIHLTLGDFCLSELVTRRGRAPAASSDGVVFQGNVSGGNGGKCDYDSSAFVCHVRFSRA